MGDMSSDERLLVQRQIASQIDYPSIYMGGPSRGAMQKAERIIGVLERGFRLRGTNCGHGSWESFRRHGTHCPTCGMKCREPENE